MREGKLICVVLASLAVTGMCLPEVMFAAEPAVTDVALGDGGVLQGQVINVQSGIGTAGVPIAVRAQDQIVANTMTGPEGRFMVQGLRGGVHQVVAGEGQGVYRFWIAGTAPPSAKTTAVVQTQAMVPATSPNVPVTYTQNGGGGGLKTWLANPLVIGGLVATAIAVPIALNNHHSSSP